MKSLTWKFLILIGFMMTGVGLGAENIVDSSSEGIRCKNSPCAYYDHGKPFPGHCGSKKGDNEYCYCYKDDEKDDQKKPSKTESKEDSSPCQKQTGCGPI